MAQLYDRLRTLREEKELTQTGLANLIGSKQQTVASWENGASRPDVNTLAELAKLYNVSTDWILGLSEFRTLEDYKTKLEQDNPTDIPEKITYGYIIDLVFKLKYIDYVEPFTGVDGMEVFKPHKLIMRDPFIICLLSLIQSKLSFSPDVDFPKLMQEIKEKYADTEVLQGNYQKMQDYYFNEVLLKSNGNLNLDIDKLFAKLKEISEE